MLARTSFKQKRHALVAKEPRVTKWPVALAVRASAAITSIAVEVVSQPKPVAHRNPHLLAMARGQSCVLKVPGVCNGNRDTTVAAHSNLRIHGKAKGRKADDQYHCHACSACHSWLDAGPATAAVKRERFMSAHIWMVSIWRDIVAGFQHGTPKDVAAACWALERLNATPIGQGEK